MAIFQSAFRRRNGGDGRDVHELQGSEYVAHDDGHDRGKPELSPEGRYPTRTTPSNHTRSNRFVNELHQRG